MPVPEMPAEYEGAEDVGSTSLRLPETLLSDIDRVSRAMGLSMNYFMGAVLADRVVREKAELGERLPPPKVRRRTMRR